MLEVRYIPNVGYIATEPAAVLRYYGADGEWHTVEPMTFATVAEAAEVPTTENVQ